MDPDVSLLKVHVHVGFYVYVIHVYSTNSFFYMFLQDCNSPTFLFDKFLWLERRVCRISGILLKSNEPSVVFNLFRSVPPWTHKEERSSITKDFIHYKDCQHPKNWT